MTIDTSLGGYYVIGYGLTTKGYALAPFTVTALTGPGPARSGQPAVAPPPAPPYPVTLR